MTKKGLAQHEPRVPPGVLPAAIEYVPIDSLRPNPRNARTHSKRQFRLIAESIHKFGFINPPIVDRNNNLLVGHARVAAAKLEGMSKVPVLRIEHLTDEQIRAYVIADNRLAELAGWDRNILAIEFQNLLEVAPDLDLSVTGFEVAEIDLLIQEAGDTVAEPESVDVEPGLVAVTAPGDLWQVGRHRILCGDALAVATYESLLGKIRAHAVFTDPPYNVKVDGHVGGLGKIRHREFAMASGEMGAADYERFLRRVCRNLARNSHPGSIHYLCIDWRHVHTLLTAGSDVYSELKNIVVWDKGNGGMGSFYRSQHEFVVVYKHGTAQHRNNIQLGQFGRNRTNVWKYPGVNQFARQTDEGRLAEVHPTVKPVAMVADAILDCTARGNVVLDAFLGSGSTLIASERVGRTCYALEIDPIYVDVAIRRWQKHTGESAVHVATGKVFNDIQAAAEVRRG